MELDIESINKFVALGGGFHTHQTENDCSYRWPDLWLVPDEAVVPAGHPIQIPSKADHVKPAAELTAVIGNDLWQASETEAWDAIKGFTISNDVTAAGDWPGFSDPDRNSISGVGYKLFPTFSPILTEYQPKPADSLPDDLQIEVFVDGGRSVHGSTSQLAFSIPELVSFASNIVRLQENDVVALGDPGNPSVLLDDADSVTATIETIGELQNPVERL